MKAFALERALVLQDCNKCCRFLSSLESKLIHLCPPETFKVIKIIYKWSLGLVASRLKIANFLPVSFHSSPSSAAPKNLRSLEASCNPSATFLYKGDVIAGKEAVALKFQEEKHFFLLEITYGICANVSLYIMLLQGLLSFLGLQVWTPWKNNFSYVLNIVFLRK